MNDELYKRLKDTGFPLVKLVKQYASTSTEGKLFCTMCGFPFVEIDGELFHQPLIETLIEACESSTNPIVFQSHSMWFAADFGGTFFGDSYIDDTLDYLTDGYETPTEAVANLWLALNEKKI